ncbi:MAG: queuosine precursor transporter [Candidatus Buchananbacteria bacterium]|nr:queuosine precursor transporter [Candidatus Buchananbacteria bacterium]
MLDNSVLFILEALVTLLFVLIAFRLGKTWLIALIAVSVVLMNIFVIKGMYLFGLAVTGGNVLYGSTSLAIDVINEHYGRKEATKAVMTGFFVTVFFLISSQFILHFQPADYDIAQSSLATLFTLTPRIVIGSMIAYLVAENLDVWLFTKIKKLTGEKYLWLRATGSTWISQLVDSITFTVIAFAGVYPLFDLILFTYLIKIIVSILDTPFIYLTRHFKPKELCN